MWFIALWFAATIAPLIGPAVTTYNERRCASRLEGAGCRVEWRTVALWWYPRLVSRAAPIMSRRVDRVYIYGSTSPPAEDLEAVASLRSIRDLHIVGSPEVSTYRVLPFGASRLLDMLPAGVGIRHLTISQDDRNDPLVANLNKFPQLVTVTVVGGHVTASSLKGLPALKGLREIELMLVTIDDGVLQTIGACNRLCSLLLSLEGDPIATEDLETLVHLEGIRRLELYNVELTDWDQSWAIGQTLEAVTLWGYVPRDVAVALVASKHMRFVNIGAPGATYGIQDLMQVAHHNIDAIGLNGGYWTRGAAWPKTRRDINERIDCACGLMPSDSRSR